MEERRAQLGRAIWMNLEGEHLSRSDPQIADVILEEIGADWGRRWWEWCLAEGAIGCVDAEDRIARSKHQPCTRFTDEVRIFW